MKFLVATYGAKHIGMLLAHLHSIRRTHPGGAIEVYHQELPGRQFEAMVRAFPEVRWTETRFALGREKLQRISSKTLAWEHAVSEQKDGETICLLDVDTLVLRSLGAFFDDPGCDVIFTFKNGGFVLNTGVMLCRINAGTRAFFERWRSETVATLGDPERFRQANDPRLPFGGADQLALHQLISYREGQTAYEVSFGEQSVRLRGEPCELLNETRSCPITERTHVVHYKGGWQLILLEGRRFSRNRPKADCWEMYLLFLSTFREALERLNETSPIRWEPRDFHLPIPRYVEERDPMRKGMHYFLFVARNWVRELTELFAGAKRLLRRKIASVFAR